MCVLLQQRESCEKLQRQIEELQQKLHQFEQSSFNETTRMKTDLNQAICDK